MATVRVSGVQMSVSRKLDDNLPRILEYIAATDADYILFPEMSLTGYHGEFSDRAARAAWRRIARACRQEYTTALIGTGCKTEGTTYIQTRIYGSDGELIGTHEKIVPTSGDREFCSPGHELRVFRQDGIVFGCLICNDLWVTPGCGPYPDPRLAYQLGRKGAQLIFHAVHSGYDGRFRAYHESNLALRARESGFPIVVANASDPAKEVNCHSGVMSAEGEWLVQVPLKGDHVFACDLELETADEEGETE